MTSWRPCWCLEKIRFFSSGSYFPFSLKLCEQIFFCFGTNKAAMQLTYTLGEKIPTVIAIKLNLKIHIGQYVSKVTVFLLKMLSVLCSAMLRYAMLCYAMLCCAVLYYSMLCYAMLCYVVLCYAMLCYAMLCYAVLCCAVLFHAMLCYAMLCYVPH